MSPWLHVVGVGEGGVAALGPFERELVAWGETVLGPPRLLAGLDGARQALVPWQAPFSVMVAQVRSLRPRPTIILATGDPSWFGIGASLARLLEPESFIVHPHPSAFSLAAARLHWPLQNVATVSLHGRPVEAIAPLILPGNRILALTTDRHTVGAVRAILLSRGYGQSVLTALENLGGAEERIRSGLAKEVDAGLLGDFLVLAVDCVADPGAPLLPAIPGLPDQAYAGDGQLTKRDMRAITLARLAPYPGALLWDIGAGSGSIGIEWMRAARDARAIAFERHPARAATIAANARALGVPDLAIVEGEAPAALAGQPKPDAVFIGGDADNEVLFAAAWAALRPGGRLAANAVTLGGQAALYARQRQWGGELVRIDIAQLDAIGSTQQVLRPRLGVLNWSVVKP